MNILTTPIKDLYILEPKVFEDARGYFMESYKQNWWLAHFPEISFVQDNESKSTRGVLRGLHFQAPPFAQTKLVRCISGVVLDVAVDLRIGSPTYGTYHTVMLSGDNKRQFLIPRGFAHGFVVLSESAIFSYKVDNPYAPECDGGILWNDPDLNIDWQIDSEEILLSEKDAQLPNLTNFNSPFKLESV